MEHVECVVKITKFIIIIICRIIMYMTGYTFQLQYLSHSTLQKNVLDLGALNSINRSYAICDRILENLPCWHKTSFRTKQSIFSESFSMPIFIAHFDKANIKLCCCKVLDIQLLFARRYGSFYTTK